MGAKSFSVNIGEDGWLSNCTKISRFLEFDVDCNVGQMQLFSYAEEVKNIETFFYL